MFGLNHLLAMLFMKVFCQFVAYPFQEFYGICLLRKFYISNNVVKFLSFMVYAFGILFKNSFYIQKKYKYTIIL